MKKFAPKQSSESTQLGNLRDLAEAAMQFVLEGGGKTPYPNDLTLAEVAKAFCELQDALRLQRYKDGGLGL